MSKYKTGEYVEYMTRQPEVHVQVMFGYGQVPLEDIEEERHVGRIKSVIGDGEAYLIISLQPLQGFYCVEDADKIIRRLEVDEVTEELTAYQDSPNYMAPNVYTHETPVDGTVEEKCVNLARTAMSSLFPEDEIEEVKFGRSYFLKEDIIGNLDSMLSFAKENSKELQEMKEEMVQEIRKMRFKEYYQVDVGVKMIVDEDPMITAFLEKQGFHSVGYGTKNYLVAIDTNFKEVVIMRNIGERSCFFRSLGPEFDNVTAIEKRFRDTVYAHA